MTAFSVVVLAMQHGEVGGGLRSGWLCGPFSGPCGRRCAPCSSFCANRMTRGVAVNRGSKPYAIRPPVVRSPAGFRLRATATCDERGPGIARILTALILRLPCVRQIGEERRGMCVARGGSAVFASQSVASGRTLRWVFSGPFPSLYPTFASS